MNIQFSTSRCQAERRQNDIQGLCCSILQREVRSLSDVGSTVWLSYIGSTVSRGSRYGFSQQRLAGLRKPQLLYYLN